MRVVIVCFLFLLPLSATAQQRDSVFDDYADYARFVDSRIMTRDFIELIQVLGGRDEYTTEQLQALQTRFQSIYSRDFTESAVSRETNLGGGFRQEMRIYWRSEGAYVYFYAMLHDRGDELVVLTFTLNSDVSKVLAEF